MTRARTLGQVIGVEKHLRQADNDAGKVIKKNIQSETLTTGLTKVYIPDDPEAPPTAREPDQYKMVAVKVEEAFREAMKYAVPAMDITATKDRTNQVANADIILPDGTSLLKNVPISHLLWLEHYLGDWKGFFSVTPTLDPAKNWTFDEGMGIHKGSVVEQVRFAKEMAVLPLTPTTKEHPGTGQPYTKETRTGKYDNTALSGAVTERRRKDLIAKADLLLAAVKDAIARANQTTAVEVSEGEILLGFLLA
jgi:hypothetical protein